MTMTFFTQSVLCCTTLMKKVLLEVCYFLLNQKEEKSFMKYKRTRIAGGLKGHAVRSGSLRS